MPNQPLITSKDNPHIKLAVRLRESARERREHGLFFLEGYRLCADALASGYVPEMLFVTEAARGKYAIKHENLIGISEQVALKLADTQSPQGIFGVFRVQDTGNRVHGSGHYIALEMLQDPANLGAIARTAEALGADGMIVSGGCDVYHPKALRASMGALLRLAVTQTEDLPAYLRELDMPCYAAVPDAGAISLTDCDFRQGGVAVIGNEGNGLSDETIAACAHKMTIPMRGRGESMNAAAAAAIILWEMTRGGRGD